MIDSINDRIMASIEIPPTPTRDEHLRRADTGPQPLMAEDPFALFAQWFAAAQASEPNDPNAMQLATCGADGLPNVRTVLLKGADVSGFVFYTHFDSAKGVELAENPKAALLFLWKSLKRQIRIRGSVAKVSAEEADAYFSARARESRIGAWASKQSRPMSSPDELREAMAAAEARFEGREPPRPDGWGGFRLKPLEIEFWREGAFRLHDRLVFRRPHVETAWLTQRLYP